MININNITTVTAPKAILTFEVIDAMTRTELIEALTTEFDYDFKECMGMTHSRMVGEYFKKTRPVSDTPSPAVPVNAATGVPLKAKKTKEGKFCACECGGTTKGGTWLPGHDAKFHAKTAQGVSKHAPKQCKCGCGEWTKGGMFRPGHDARYYSALHASAKIGVKPEFLPPTLDPNALALVTITKVA